MSKLIRYAVRGALAAVAVGIVAPPSFAFFPPIVAPINRPVVVTVTPVTPEPVLVPTPVIVPSVEPCVKPTVKVRPKVEYCYCTTTTTGTSAAANTPEPATLISAGIGAAIAGAASWVKRRRKVAA